MENSHSKKDIIISIIALIGMLVSYVGFLIVLTPHYGSRFLWEALFMGVLSAAIALTAYDIIKWFCKKKLIAKANEIEKIDNDAAGNRTTRDRKDVPLRHSKYLLKGNARVQDLCRLCFHLDLYLYGGVRGLDSTKK